MRRVAFSLGLIACGGAVAPVATPVDDTPQAASIVVTDAMGSPHVGDAAPDFDLTRNEIIGVQEMNVPETFAFQAFQATLQVSDLPADDVRSEGPVRPLAISVQADPLRYIEDNGRSQTMVTPGEIYQSFPVIRTHVGSVHHG